jgi:hypothetical protein
MMEPNQSNWMAFYARLTWAVGTFGFAALISEVFQPIYKVALKGLSPTSVIQVVAALALFMAVGAFMIQRRLRLNPPKMKAAIRRLSICWGLADGVFMYGVMAQIVSGSLWTAAPFYAVACLLALRTFPSEKLMKLSLDDQAPQVQPVRAA